MIWLHWKIFIHHTKYSKAGGIFHAQTFRLLSVLLLDSKFLGCSAYDELILFFECKTLKLEVIMNLTFNIFLLFVYLCAFKKTTTATRSSARTDQLLAAERGFSRITLLYNTVRWFCCTVSSNCTVPSKVISTVTAWIHSSVVESMDFFPVN